MAKSLLNEVSNDGALAKHLPSLFKSYPNMSVLHTTSYFLWSEKTGQSQENLLEVCHASLTYKSTGWSHMVTAVPKSDELSLEYLRMLVNGPFKAMAVLISLEQEDGKYYLRLSHLDRWPANVLYKFCIASRLPIEFHHFLPRWSKLVEQGYNSTLALLLSYSNNGQEWVKGYKRVYPNKHHLWFDPASNWANIIKGDMVGLSVPYAEYPAGCRPCNKIWGVSGDYSKFMEMPDEEISAFMQLPIEPLVPLPKVKTLEQKIAELNAGVGIPVNLAWALNGAGQAQQPPPPQPAHADLHVDLDDDDDDFDEWHEPDFDEDDDDED